MPSMLDMAQNANQEVVAAPARFEERRFQMGPPVRNCHHAFIMLGTQVMECKNCGWGLFIKGVKEFEMLKEKLHG